MVKMMMIPKISFQEKFTAEIHYEGKKNDCMLELTCFVSFSLKLQDKVLKCMDNDRNKSLCFSVNSD